MFVCFRTAPPLPLRERCHRKTQAIRLARTLLFAGVAMLQTACIALAGGALQVMEEEKEFVRIDPRFSFNVAKVPNWFPGEDLPLNDTEKIVYLTKGAPDYIRFWWNDEGTFIRSSDFSGRMSEVSDMVKDVERSWIYLKEGIEVRFPRRGGYAEETVDDMTRAVCNFGDPTSRATPKFTKDGKLRENWRWVDMGVLIDFLDREEIRRTYFQGTGKGTILTH